MVGTRIDEDLNIFARRNVETGEETWEAESLVPKEHEGTFGASEWFYQTKEPNRWSQNPREIADAVYLALVERYELNLNGPTPKDQFFEADIQLYSDLKKSNLPTGTSETSL